LILLCGLIDATWTAAIAGREEQQWLHELRQIKLPRNTMMEIEMKIRGLMMDPTANTPIIILKDVNGEAMLPIWVGPFEAQAIAVEIEKLASQRPMTHDLLKNVIWELGAAVRRIIITDLIDNTFFAVIEMTRDGEVLTIDSRPSDAIALALRVDCPIYVNDEVIKNSSTSITEEPSSPQDDWPEDLIDDASEYKM
jgi:bifunctional DNase/RNase